MSRESLLDDAIIKAKEAEDWQLVEWLRMARGSEKASRWYTVKLRELQSENAKLRELVKDMWGWLTVRTVSGAALHDLSGRMRELGISES